MSDLTVEALMDRMPKAFKPEKAEGVDAVIQYHLTGEGGGDWVVRIEDGECEVERGTAEAPNLTLTSEADDYLGIFTGQYNAMQAFMQGKIKLAGDLNLAMKLPEYFKMN